MPRFERVAILGATGPTGIQLAKTVEGRVEAIRVVSRSEAHLERLFPGEGYERVPADALVAEQALRAVEGCDLVFDCIGLPAHLMDRHAAVASNVAEALGKTGARGVQISSYWSYMPIRDLPLDESHPREDGPEWAKLRREAEDILQQAGAAILQLPDFFGPQVHTSTVQNALREAVAGSTMNWIGSVDTEHEFIYVPDAMRVAVELAEKEAAYGERFLVPGSGPLTGARLAEIAGDVLGRKVKARGAGPGMLRLVSLFRRELRSFMPMVPEYVKPIRYDGSKLEALLGPTERTPYPDAVRETVRGIESE